MRNTSIIFVVACGLACRGVDAQRFAADVAPLIEESCLHCHDATTSTVLNFDVLGHDLDEPDTFDRWEQVYDRIRNGEMPPEPEPRPDPEVLETAMASLKGALVDANIRARGGPSGPRASLRRLTRLEYAHTIQDLLGIDEAIAKDLALALPAEADSGGFDTVAANQSISPLHVRSYLQAADRALDAAIQQGPQPRRVTFRADYAQSLYLRFIADGKGLGLGIVKKLDDAYVAFFDFGATYTFHSDSEGFRVPAPGRYRVALEAYPYQADTPVVLSVYRGRKQGIVASLDELIGTFDLVGDEPRTVEMTPFLQPGDLIGPSVADLDGNPFIAQRNGNPDDGYDMTNYRGEGLALKSLTIEGPLHDTWPPTSTRELLRDVAFDERGRIQEVNDPYQTIVEIVAEFAPRAFRRPLVDGELEAYAGLAKPVLAEGRPFIEAVRIPLRAILNAPDFLYLPGESRSLDDFALASRLSYFLWRSMPDETLFDLARAGRLSDPEILAEQVDRMLDDPKSQRFVKDFAGQAFRLDELKATAPDPGLYPEYDDRLGQAMAAETELFLTELIAGNYGAGTLIDADFTFVNRRLAEHYGIPGVEWQVMRKVGLPADSPRGGLLGQASIHKITANGTVTSPIPRGNYVLTNLLGTPTPPPIPGAGSLEPDTRGASTIREQLVAHRASPQCARCHRQIDPPGFALEEFDPIGGYRTRYRLSSGEMQLGDYTVPLPYRQGKPVDASGVTPDGVAFEGIETYKRNLLKNQLDQVARHLASQLLVFSTGAEIEFADRDAVEDLLDATRADGFGIREIIHQVVRSDLFRNR